MRNILFSYPEIGTGEIEEVKRVMESGWITTGPETKEFEREITKFTHADRTVCLSSATACLEAILYMLGIREGDEVIVPAYTYTASASPVVHLGGKLVFVDCAKDSFEMDYDAVEKAITKKTKAIIPVDIGGIMCDYDRIFEIVEKHKDIFKPSTALQRAIGRVAVIVDSAHGFGATYKGRPSGSVGDFTSFSFHAVKNFTTAEGGALTWKTFDDIEDDMLYNDFMLYSLHGQSKDALNKTIAGSWEYDVIYPAYKCNMTDIMAGMGVAHMKTYDQTLKRRREIIERYDAAFKPLGLKVMNHFNGNGISSGHLYLLRVPGIDEDIRNDIIAKLGERGISANVHYKPLPMLTAYKNLGFNIEDFPNAFNQFRNEISLPLYSKLEDDDVDYVIENLIDILKEYV